MYAAMNNHVAAIRALAGANHPAHWTTAGAPQFAANAANVSAADDLGNTAIMYATMRGHLAAVRALVQQGADAQAANNKRRTAYSLADEYAHISIMRWLARCAPPPRSGWVGWEAIHLACDGRCGVPHLTALLRGGADPASAGSFETPFKLCKLADPAQGALPEDAAMTELIQQALKPWAPERHGLFPRTFTPRVVVVLLVDQRQEQYALEYAQQQLAGQPPTQRQRRLGKSLRLRLSRDVWLQSVVPFLPRFGVPPPK